MGANILKGGGDILGHSPLWGGHIPRIFFPGMRGANFRGGDKSPVTTAWAKIYLAPPKYEFAPQMPPKF